MVPLMEAAIHGYVMYWANILSDRIATEILEHRRKRCATTLVIPPFHYSTYILNIICFNSEYPILEWKWNPQDPNPIHIYHKELWKAHYRNHLYIIFNGFVLPVYYSIFNKPSPRISEEAGIDLTTVGSWFGEEKFTYVRLFGSLTTPHVLPMYVLDKLFPWELAYQITVARMSKTLTDFKKHMWPTFPLWCGTFTLHDYKHAEKEAKKIQISNLVTIPRRQYDPKKASYNVTSQANLTRFDHKEDIFDDLFSSTELFFHVKGLAMTKIGIEKFSRIRAQRLESLPLDLLATNPTVQPQAQIEQKIVENNPEVEKVPKKEKTS